MTRKFRIAKIYIGAVLALIYLPIVIVVIYSFNKSKSGAVFTGLTLDWYRRLFSSKKHLNPLINSLTAATVSSLAAAVIGTLAAVGTATRSFKSKGLFESVAAVPIMIPEVILGMAYLGCFALIGLPMGLPAIIAAHTTFCIPYIYLIVGARLKDMDKSVPEAARDLGASRARTFVTVTLPLIFPAVLSGSLLAFAMSFDDVIISFFLTAPGSEMLPVKVFSSLKLGVSPDVNALFTLMLAVMLTAMALGLIINRVILISNKKGDSRASLYAGVRKDKRTKVSDYFY